MDVSHFEASIYPPATLTSSSVATPLKKVKLKRQISPGSFNLLSVPTCFNNSYEYLKIWEPLALQEGRANIHQIIDKLKGNIDIDGGTPNVAALKCRIISMYNNSTSSTTSSTSSTSSTSPYIRVELRFLDTPTNGGRRNISNAKHTFGHYKMINLDARSNPLRRKLILLLSSQRRIRPAEKLRKSQNNNDQIKYTNKCGRLCLGVVEQTSRKKINNEWSITVRIETKQWNALYEHTR